MTSYSSYCGVCAHPFSWITFCNPDNHVWSGYTTFQNFYLSVSSSTVSLFLLSFYSLHFPPVLQVLWCSLKFWFSSILILYYLLSNPTSLIIFTCLMMTSQVWTSIPNRIPKFQKHIPPIAICISILLNISIWMSHKHLTFSMFNSEFTTSYAIRALLMSTAVHLMAPRIKSR